MILIDNAAQSGLLTMRECIDALERAFGAIDSGPGDLPPRDRRERPELQDERVLPLRLDGGLVRRHFRHLRHPTAIRTAIRIGARSTG